MASNHTEKYQLSQWEPEDSFLRLEFNEDNQKIESALEGLKALCNCQIHLQSYTGTGEQISRTLTFPYRPILVAIQGNSTLAFGIQGSSKLHGRDSANTYIEPALTWGERTMTINGTIGGSLYGCNGSGTVYRVAALMDVNEA